MENLENGAIASENEIENRKKKLINSLKKNLNWIYYSILAVIISVSLFIRTRNIPKLKDITTGTWTLGPDLDPFLFLRWAQYIVEHGKLFLLDTMRSVPLASICSGEACNPVNTAGEMKLLSYMIAWLSKSLSFFNSEISVTYAAIILPVIMAGLTGIAFFLFARKIFYKEDGNTANIIALVSTAFFILIPSLLPRTIAGIPEKEAVAFFFMFMAFYFFLESFTSEKLKKSLIFALLAGIMTALLGLTWGGVTFAFLAIAGAELFAFLFKKINIKKLICYSVWLSSSAIIMMLFSTRYTLESLIVSTSTGLAFLVLFIIGFDFLVFKKSLFNIGEKIKNKVKIPEKILSILLALAIILIVSSIVFGISFIPDTFNDVISHTIEPFTPSRFGVTVAENKQPYFVSEWKGDFGPTFFDIPVYFWLFFAGSVFLFNYMISSLKKKEKRILTAGYAVFLFCLIFSKYSSTSIFNGESLISLAVYFGGAFCFILPFVYFYFKKEKEGNFSDFEKLDFSYLFYFMILTLMVVAARGAVRLIMVLGAVSPIAVGFLVVKITQKYLREKEDFSKLITGIAVLLVLISSIFTIVAYYQSDVSMAENYAPSYYTQQWQKAMEWVRNNTPKEAVFAHWWDYGYWVQSIGERATILDGGNAVGYWNHFMGRLVLTGTDEKTALDFLYAHNGTHLLIDSTEIGKYGAFSSIGSDENYDRYSWMPTILLDETQTRETNNQTMKIYPVGTATDEDILFNEDGKEILLPRRKTAVVAIAMIENSEGGVLQPVIFFNYNNKQYQMPLRYVYTEHEMLDFSSGFDAGIFLFARGDTTENGQFTLVENGAAIYLSSRTVHSQIAELYLAGKKSSSFKLALTQSNLLIEDLKNQGLDIGEFLYYQGFQGPIKIWEISYPAGMQIDEKYLSTDYPEELGTVIPGEY